MRPSLALLAIVIIGAAFTLLIAVLRPDDIALVSVFWIGLILLGLLDLALSFPAKNLQVEHDFPEEGFTATGSNFRIAIMASKGLLPKRLFSKLELDENLTLAADLPVLGGEQAGLLRGVLMPASRGEKAIKAAYFSWGSRIGLFDIVTRSPIDKTIRIIPNIQPVTNGEILTQMLPILDGIKDAQNRGEGSEFHQLREFVSGMDTRSIDWKRSAKMRNLVARETRAERNHHIMIAVDNGHLMAQHTDQFSKLDRAINAALALCWAGGIGGDQVGFYSFNARPGRMIPARPGREAFPILRRELATLEESFLETNHTWGLSHLNSVLKKRSLVVIFSDFLDTTSAELMIENLAALRKQHVVLYVSLKDPVLDLEIATKSTALEDVARSVAASGIKNERERMLEEMRHLGLLVLDVHPDALTTALISKYMDIKLQELI